MENNDKVTRSVNEKRVEERSRLRADRKEGSEFAAKLFRHASLDNLVLFAGDRGPRTRREREHGEVIPDGRERFDGRF